jgi:hypothetical protein
VVFPAPGAEPASLPTAGDILNLRETPKALAPKLARRKAPSGLVNSHGYRNNAKGCHNGRSAAKPLREAQLHTGKVQRLDGDG